MHLHGGTGSPDYGRHAAVPMIMIAEVPLLRHAQLRAHAALRRVRALPAPQVRDHRGGPRAFAPLLGHLDGDHRQRAQGCDRRAQVRRGHRAAAVGQRVLPAERAGSARASPARPTSRPATSSAPTGSCGAATTRTTRAPGPTPGSTCARCARPARGRDARRSSAATRRSSTASTSTRSRRWPPSTARRSRELASRSPSCRPTRTEPCCGHAATTASA